MISCADVIRIAPSFIRLFVPIPYLLSIVFGMQNTGFPCFLAIPAVIVVPLLCPASTTKTPSDSPLTILFLFGNFVLSGSIYSGYSVITVPFCSKISLYKSIFSLGYMCEKPLPHYCYSSSS